MQSLVTSRQTWLTRPRVVGTPLAWARGTALYGGLLGGAVPTGMAIVQLSFSWTDPHWSHQLVALVFLDLCSALTGTMLGGALGGVQPELLDRLRRRVPLPLLALGQTAVGALAGGAVGAMWILPLALAGLVHPLPTHFLQMGATGAAAGGLGTAIGWLPFTMAMVLGRRTWPVTATVVSVVTALVSLLYAGLFLF